MIQDQLKRVMSGEADRLRPPDRLAETIIARGRRVRRSRRVGLGVAVVSGVVAAAVLPGTLFQSSRQDPAVTPTPTTTSGQRADDPPFSTLPKGPRPRVPYTLGNVTTGGYLQDGETRVRIAPGLRIDVISRVDGGWFASRTDRQGRTVLGIKRPAGDFTALGSPAGGYWTGSQDGKRVAFVSVDGERRYHLVVFDVRTGQRTASTPVTRLSEIMGWNSHGVWYVSSVAGHTNQTRTYVWQPGESPRLVPRTRYLVVEQHPTRMIHIPGGNCAEVVTLGSAGRLETLRRFCGPGISGGDLATLSPDGRYIVLPDGTARDVGTGKIVKIRRSIMMPPVHQSWEDDTHVLLADYDGVTNSKFTNVQIRCNVRTGRCERAFDQPKSEAPLDGRHYFSVATR